MLRQLVNSMDWTTGLITGLTTQRLATAGNRAPRTVSRLLAWARDIGLLVVVECGASATFLATTTNRTPTYALVTNTPHPPTPTPTPTAAAPPTTTKPQANTPVEESGDLPHSYEGSKPSTNDTRLTPTGRPTPTWPIFQIPDTPAERTSATRCLLHRIGLDGAGVSGAPLWRARAQLTTWWDQGACVAGLLYALDHHPDHPTHHRGDALRGAHHPLRVLGHRLTPWKNRLHQLPPTLTGIHGDYRTHQTDNLARRTTTTHPATTANPTAANNTASAAARAALTEHLRALRAQRTSRNE